MPWSAKDATRHDKKATGSKGATWSKVANSVLAKSGDEGKAIRVANSVIGKFVKKNK